MRHKKEKSIINLQDFLILLLDVADEVRKELEERKAGKEGVGSVEDLSFIYTELASLGEKLMNADSLQQTDRPSLKSAGIVMHSWPAQESLGERICMIDYLYKNQLTMGRDMR